ncbi:MAG: outer membrane lipoprotein chaperone LolA [Rhodoferax sp.]|uniref:outer membrane lipoprotein chaperone LolA n=1 Tax=Rhodoferax sp. TaxID=50421 RepID=UPI001B45DE5F|nr:outer membrane lipoprotein chaperone LolA [Rhodoferax sp.]MBP9148094.1 outer membrane lipoprotein chaperone LolA [Rhodoferax sp.]MBP9736755.1 outer membrane lipoprotein chaperone LolA [Rhodoferax sp.]
MKRLLTIFIALNSITAWAGGTISLEKFVKMIKTGRAEFTQVVTSPARQGQAPRSKTSSGSFEFSRPDRFKFIYKKPFAQSIVADGQTLWLHDPDLNQVTARKQAGALASTPAALIASAQDLQSIQRDFTLTDGPDHDGQQWVLATPKSRDNAVQSVRVGFRGETLSALEIVDSFGQSSMLAFSGFEANPALPPSGFEFKVPAGADVIRQ